MSRVTGDSAAAGGDWGPGGGGRQPGLHRGRHPRHRAPLPGQWYYLAAGVRSYITLHYNFTVHSVAAAGVHVGGCAGAGGLRVPGIIVSLSC